MARGGADRSEVEAWVERLRNPQRELVNDLRRLIRETAPNLEETMKWGQPCYTVGPANVVYLAPIADRVNFGFFRGADLRDPQRFLEGTGKKLRHVKVWLDKDIPTEALKALIREATALARAR